MCSHALKVSPCKIFIACLSFQGCFYQTVHTHTYGNQNLKHIKSAIFYAKMSIQSINVNFASRSLRRSDSK